MNDSRMIIDKDLRQKVLLKIDKIRGLRSQFDFIRHDSAQIEDISDFISKIN